MENNVKEKAKKAGGRIFSKILSPFKKMSKKKLAIISVLLVAVVSVSVIFGVMKGGKAAAEYAYAQVTRGDITVSITGSGTIEPIDQYEVTSLVKGEIIYAPIEEGDTVEEGDLLYRIDSEDAQNSYESSYYNYQDALDSYNDLADDRSKLTVKSSIAGTVTALHVKEGDTVQNGTVIADITDNENMILKIPFLASDAASISVGQTASVTLSGSGNQTVSGTVTHVATGVSSSSAAVRTVEISVKNTGTIKSGDKAAAVIGSVACNDYGTFETGAERSITAEIGGTLASVNVSEGDKVSKNMTICVIDDESYSDSLKSSQRSLNQAELSLDNQRKTLEGYEITSPISGTVIQKNSKQGDTLDNTNSTTTMAIIADMSTIIFEISVDELDISKIQLGQEVSITADAIEGISYTGYVDYISIVGTTTNGVTTYPVRIVVNDPEDLIPGMNVDAEIVVEKAKNVLMIPVSAVSRGNTVEVYSAGETANDSKDSEKTERGDAQNTENANENQKSEDTGKEEAAKGNTPSPPDSSREDYSGKTFDKTEIETGVSDSTWIEVKSGLNEGDVVRYITANIAEDSDSSGSEMGGGMPGGGMGGGMPGGGMGGGMPAGMGGGAGR